MKRDNASILDIIEFSNLKGNVRAELPGGLVISLKCSKCGDEEKVIKLLQAITSREAICPECGIERVPEVIYESEKDSEVSNMKLEKLGFPLMDIITLKCNNSMVQVELSGDLDYVICNSEKRDNDGKR